MVLSRMAQEKYWYILNTVSYSLLTKAILQFIAYTAWHSERHLFESIFRKYAYFALYSKIQKELKRVSKQSRQIIEFSIIASMRLLISMKLNICLSACLGYSIKITIIIVP